MRVRFSLGVGLSWEQRYQFLSGWLPVDFRRAGHGRDLHGADLDPADVGRAQLHRRPDAGLSAAAMALFATKLVKTLLLYPPKSARVSKARSGLGRGAGAHPHGGEGGWSGLITANQPFLRTPKCADPAQ